MRNELISCSDILRLCKEYELFELISRESVVALVK